MKDAQKPDHKSLNSLVSWLKEGRFVIPDFQREFEWEPWDIRELMRSIFLDYYIGSLLLWKGQPKNFAALSCESIYGYPEPGTPEYIVLDGQQRLTAMYYAFFLPDVPLPNRTRRAFYYIRVDQLMADAQEEAFGYEWLTKRRAGFLSNPKAQYEEHIFPLSVIGQGGWELANWAQGYESYWRNRAQTPSDESHTTDVAASIQHADNAKTFGELLKGITDEYQISYIELDREIAVDKVCDIFTQINSKGIRLDAFDLINAMLKPKGLQLKHMWRKAEPRLSFIDTRRMNVYTLMTMSILRQAYCSPKYLYFLIPGAERPIRESDGTLKKEVLVPDTQDFEKRWNHAVDALEDSINLLRQPQELGAIASKYVPYESILPVFAALQAHLKEIPAPKRLDGKRKIHHWYWASVFTKRYSGSVESTSARDFLDVKSWIENDEAEPPLLLEFKQQFSALDLRGETKAGTSVYNGIFNLLVLQGARDWMSGNVPQHDDLDDHHIVPASWGNKHLSNGIVNTILNRSPLTSDTNRNIIKERLPNQYLPELIAENGEAQVRAILESHFISPAGLAILLRDPFEPADFEAFISERQRTLQQAIENLLVKERLDLPPQLRELDEQIEKTELSLRGLIDALLGGDPAKLPANVASKAKERIQRALKKNAALDPNQLTNLPGILEFTDLRELEQIIVGNHLWPVFQHRFANKAVLSARFNQLAELRNGIRHSRSVDEVIRKEGEAAILWFDQILGKSA